MARSTTKRAKAQRKRAKGQDKGFKPTSGFASTAADESGSPTNNARNRQAMLDKGVKQGKTVTQENRRVAGGRVTASRRGRIIQNSDGAEDDGLTAVQRVAQGQGYRVGTATNSSEGEGSGDEGGSTDEPAAVASDPSEGESAVDGGNDGAVGDDGGAAVASDPGNTAEASLDPLGALTALNTALQGQITANNARQAQLERENAQLQSTIATQTQTIEQNSQFIAQTQQTIDNLTSVFNSTPNAGENFGMPAINTHLAHRREPTGDVAELYKILDENSKGQVVSYGRNAGQAYAYDPRKMRRALNQMAKGDRKFRNGFGPDNPLWEPLTEHGKKLGFYQGNNNIDLFQNAAGPTTGLTAEGGHLDILSNLMRESNVQDRLWPNFTVEAYNPSSRPSNIMQVPRINYMPDATDETLYEGNNSTTYTPIADPQGAATDVQSADVQTVNIRITEKLLGLGGTVETRPFWLPELEQATSAYDLMMIIDMNLGRNWRSYESLKARLRYQESTKIVYWDGDSIVNAPAAVTAGGTFSEAAADAMWFYMYGYTEGGVGSSVLPLPDGKYICVMPSGPAKQMKADRRTRNRSLDRELLPFVNGLIQQQWGNAGAVEVDPHYFGSDEKFHYFTNNELSQGAAGVDPNVNSITYGAGGPIVSDDVFFFGAGAVMQGTGMPMQIRTYTAPFDRATGLIWLYWGGWAAADVDSALAGNQQSRVHRLRIPRQAVA